MDVWQSRLFHAALQALHISPPPPPAATALCTALRPGLSLLHALSPKATRAFLSDLDDLLRASAHSASASPLSALARVFVDARSRAALVCVGPQPPDNPAPAPVHVVVLRDVVAAAHAPQVLVHPASHRLSPCSCTCRAFAFRPRGEAFCKHVVLAAVAACAGLACVVELAEDDFLTKLAGSPAS